MPTTSETTRYHRCPNLLPLLLALILLGVTLQAALVACGAKHNKRGIASATSSAAAPTTSTSAVASKTPASPQEAAITAYENMHRAFLKASETADPDYPDLPRYASGRALQLLRDGLTSMRDKGLRGRGDVSFHSKVESMQPAANPTKAEIRDCLDTRTTQQYKANGDYFSDPPGGFRLVLAEAEVVDGTWKVTALGIREVGTCTI